MVVFASGELQQIRECCNFVYNLQAHIVFFMCDMRYNCVLRFSDGYRGGGGVRRMCVFSVNRRKNIWGDLGKFDHFTFKG